MSLLRDASPKITELAGPHSTLQPSELVGVPPDLQHHPQHRAQHLKVRLDIIRVLLELSLRCLWPMPSWTTEPSVGRRRARLQYAIGLSTTHIDQVVPLRLVTARPDLHVLNNALQRTRISTEVSAGHKYEHETRRQCPPVWSVTVIACAYAREGASEGGTSTHRPPDQKPQRERLYYLPAGRRRVWRR